jgi:ferritin
MDQEMQDALNRQINKELFAAYLYLSMCAHFETRSLNGFARWMRAQAREELDHAMRIFDHLNERGARVELWALDEPGRDFGGPAEVFQQALDHEKAVTEMIHRLYDMAMEKHDHATQLLLEWFITEQVEEEDSVGTVVDQLRMAGDNQAAILMLDRELGARQHGAE